MSFRSGACCWNTDLWSDQGVGNGEFRDRPLPPLCPLRESFGVLPDGTYSLMWNTDQSNYQYMLVVISSSKGLSIIPCLDLLGWRWLA